jgi:GNAT superfamily N-acetyltransferase
MVLHIPYGYSYECLRPVATAENPVNIEDNLFPGGAISKNYSIIEAHYDYPAHKATISAWSKKTYDEKTLYAFVTPMPQDMIDNGIRDIRQLYEDEDLDVFTEYIIKEALFWYEKNINSESLSTLIIQGTLYDIYGIGTKDVVAVSEMLISKGAINPIALLHEIMHAYLNSMDKDDASDLLSRIRGSLAPGRKKWLTSRDALNNTHYILREWQREKFGEKDSYLTQLISEIQKNQENIKAGELFVLGDRYIDIDRLFPIAEALEKAIYNTGPGSNEFRDLSISRLKLEHLKSPAASYPGNNLDVYIYNESGVPIASFNIFPLRKADGITYDKDGVFLSSFSIEHEGLRYKGCGTALYRALKEFLKGLGYSRIYGTSKDHISDAFWEKMGWEPSSANIYVPSKLFEWYSEKPVNYKNHQPTVARLLEGRITPSIKTSSSGNIDELWDGYLRYGVYEASTFLYKLGIEYPFNDIEDAIPVTMPIEKIKLYHILHNVYGYERNSFQEPGQKEQADRLRVQARTKMLESFMQPKGGTMEGLVAMLDKNNPESIRIKSAFSSREEFITDKEVLMLFIIQSARQGKLDNFLKNSIKKWGRSRNQVARDRYYNRIRLKEEDLHIIRQLSGMEKDLDLREIWFPVQSQGFSGAQDNLIKWFARQIHSDKRNDVQLQLFPDKEHKIDSLIRQAG